MSPKTATLSPKPATLSPKTQCCRFRRHCCRFWRHCRWCGRGFMIDRRYTAPSFSLCWSATRTTTTASTSTSSSSSTAVQLRHPRQQLMPRRRSRQHVKSASLSVIFQSVIFRSCIFIRPCSSNIFIRLRCKDNMMVFHFNFLVSRPLFSDPLFWSPCLVLPL